MVRPNKPPRTNDRQRIETMTVFVTVSLVQDGKPAKYSIDDGGAAHDDANHHERRQIDHHRDGGQHDRNLQPAAGYFQHVVTVHLVIALVFLFMSLFCELLHAIGAWL